MNRFYYQQGGAVAQPQEMSEAEQIMFMGICGYIGANPDKTALEAVLAVVPAFLQLPDSLNEIVLDEDLVKKGMAIMKQKEPEALQLLATPGMLTELASNLELQAKLALMAKHGAKLNYIKSLKHICPEGYELMYMRKGGTVCPVCNKVHKAKKASTGGQVEKDCGGTKVMSNIKKAMACGGKVKKHQNGGYTEDLIAGRQPVKVVNGVKYFLNGDGKVVKDPKGVGSLSPEMRDSMIVDFNKFPTKEKWIKIQKANRILAEWDDLNPNKGKRIDTTKIRPEWSK